MGNQFKKPFQAGGEPRSKRASLSGVSEQSTVIAPAVNMPPPGPRTQPDSMPGQGYVKGQFGLYGQPPKSSATNQTFPESLPGSMQGFGGAQQGGMPPMGQPFGGPQGGMQTGQSFGGPSGGMQANSLFGGMQAPPVTPMGGSGTAFGPQGAGAMGGMGAGMMPSPAWGAQQNAQRGLPEKAGSVRQREKNPLAPGKKGSKKRRFPIWARVVSSILLFFIVLVGAVYAYYQVNFASTVNTITGKQFARANGETDPNQGKSGSVLNWGRVNILLLGSDTDEKPIWGGNSFLAQTVIVASIDTGTHEVDMLSIPRDFYIPIPGYGVDKLDTAFAYGGSVNNNMSGVTTVVDTLDVDFGIKINFYAWVGLQGFIKVINTVGGVDVNVMHPIVDDTYPDDITSSGKSKSGYAYKRVYIGDGPQHLDGPTALEYVRSRHSTNDFDRSARQQEVLSSLRLKLDNPGIFGELPTIAADLKGSLYTSLSPTQLLDLGNFARGIDVNKIKHLTLGGTKYSTNATVKRSGADVSVVYPNCTTIPETLNSFLHMTTGTCNVSASLKSQVPALASTMGSNASGSQAASPLASAAGLANSATLASSELSPGAYAPSNLFGMRDLLDLMAMTVLDSPQA